MGGGPLVRLTVRPLTIHAARRSVKGREPSRHGEHLDHAEHRVGCAGVLVRQEADGSVGASVQSRARWIVCPLERVELSPVVGGTSASDPAIEVAVTEAISLSIGRCCVVPGDTGPKLIRRGCGPAFVPFDT